LGFLAFFLVLPLVVVFVEAFAKGIPFFLRAIAEPDALSAIKLTLLTVAIVLPMNVVFGVAAAWSIAKFKFKRQEPADHADRPALRRVPDHLRPGLCADLRRAGLVRPWLIAHNVRVIFAVPASCLPRPSSRSRLSPGN
jgi:sulfate transport system permease protein